MPAGIKGSRKTKPRARKRTHEAESCKAVKDTVTVVLGVVTVGMFMTAGNGRSREACDGVNLDRGRDVPFVASEAEGGEEALSDLEFPELPGWRFTVEEVSARVYRVRGMDSLGRSVETTRVDDTAAVEWCRRRRRDY